MLDLGQPGQRPTGRTIRPGGLRLTRPGQGRPAAGSPPRGRDRRGPPERSGSNTPLVTYTRGRDLSGSLDGAGGIGGLLARSHGYSGGNWSSHNFYHADGNGNVTALVNSSGVLQASYQYDPYGRYLGGSGTLAGANLQRFSSKPWVGFAGSTTAGLYACGYRFYDPSLQRWPNRDPINELGFNLLIRSQNPFNWDEEKHLYGFAHNNPVNRVDIDGRIVPVIVIAGAWAAWQGICTVLAANEAVKAFPADDKKKHCFASCYHNRCTGLFQPAFTLIGGVLFEYLVGVYDFKDIQADAYGIITSYHVWESCKKACDRCPIK